jgi:hypothetical protein
MNISRRHLLFLLLVRPPQSTSLQVSVLETFVMEDKTRAILVNHGSPSSREQFARWLQAHPQSSIRIRSKTEPEAEATIFRVRMCFGRGLIVLDKPMTIREGEVLTIRAM